MLISLKFIISDRLPKISYLTTLDRYLHTSYFVMIILISHVCLAQMKSKLSTEPPNTSELSNEMKPTSTLLLLQSLIEFLPSQIKYFLSYDYEGYLAIFLFVTWTGIHLSMLNWFSIICTKLFGIGDNKERK